MVKCPVCGKYDFEERDDYDVCDICGWENDDLQNNDPGYEGGANWPSLNQARANYKKYGEKMSPQDKSDRAAYWKKRHELAEAGIPWSQHGNRECLLS